MSGGTDEYEERVRYVRLNFMSNANTGRPERRAGVLSFQEPCSINSCVKEGEHTNVVGSRKRA